MNSSNLLLSDSEAYLEINGENLKKGLSFSQKTLAILLKFSKKVGVLTPTPFGMIPNYSMSAIGSSINV